MKIKKTLCLILTVASLFTMTACGGGKKNVSGDFKSDMPTGEVGYPIKTEETLTYWCELPSSIATDVTNFGETAFAKDLQEKTGIKIEYIHPAAGTAKESLQLLMASGKMPDMIQTGWLSLGPQSYIDNKQIYSLNSIMESGYTPNFMKFLNENEDIKKMVKTDAGQFYAFPFVRNDDVLLSYSGYVFRKDWLEADGLEVPETIEEWDEVLASFKKRCDTPMAITGYSFKFFASGFDAYYGEYIKDEEVVYGPTEKNFKAYLEKMHEWYEKGYIDKNYAIADAANINANILNDKSGVTFTSGGGGMGAFFAAKKGTEFDLAAAPYPTTKKGEPAKFGAKELKYGVSAVAITTSCKNPALAARFLDYGYSEEGRMTYNFGKEGSSYNMVNGYPTYVDEIKANAEGKSMSQMLAHNCLAGASGPFVQDKRYLEQYYGTPQQQDAVAKWASCEMQKYSVPQIILTADEKDDYTAIMGEIGTYVDEMVNKFISGKESLDKFDEFVAEIKNLGIDDALAIKQAAYERYLSR